MRTFNDKNVLYIYQHSHIVEITLSAHPLSKHQNKQQQPEEEKKKTKPIPDDRHLQHYVANEMFEPPLILCIIMIIIIVYLFIEFDHFFTKSITVVFLKVLAQMTQQAVEMNVGVFVCILLNAIKYKTGRYHFDETK